MDPNSGKIYTLQEMDNMLDAEKSRLVKMEGRPEDIERIGRAVELMNRKERRRANRQNGLRSNGDPK